MIIALSCLIAIAAILFILWIRPADLPPPLAESPFQHLDDRKAAIYENLRDLQFEYRIGKLSDADYQNTKEDLQRELAHVLAEIDRLQTERGAPPQPAEKVRNVPSSYSVCANCGAKFTQKLKFCGECGKPMKVTS